jgi:hypothetical protein
MFHLSTAWNSAWQVFQRIVGGVGLGAASPQSSPLLGADSMCVVQMILLDAGLLLALYLAWRVSLGYVSRGRASIRLLAPWAVVSVGLYVCGVWIFLQPMQLRGLAPSAPLL